MPNHNNFEACEAFNEYVIPPFQDKYCQDSSLTHINGFIIQFETPYKIFFAHIQVFLPQVAVLVVVFLVDLSGLLGLVEQSFVLCKKNQILQGRFICLLES